MSDFTVTILGSGSAVPTSWHNPSSQIVFHSGRQFLIDCGEGTQMQMIRHKVRRKNLDHIFISHLHGDHYFGLIGLLNTFHLMRRKKPLHLYAPHDLKKIIDVQLEVSNTTLFYPLLFHSLEDCWMEPLYDDGRLSINAFPLKHSISVWGFLFKEINKLRRLDKEFVKRYKPSIEEMVSIKKGNDYTTTDGLILRFEGITLPPHPSRSFAYCSDTAYLKSTSEYAKGASLLYHESTFDNLSQELAVKTLHSTAADAARVAKEAGAGKLLLGHYSARFGDLENLLQEAKEIFPMSQLSIEGQTYCLD